MRWFAASSRFSTLLSVLICGSLLATTIDPLTWEQLVDGADFVGIVECETAGGIVARYRVVESWKGLGVGSGLTLQIPPDYWEPQFPIALCGERYLVTAFKSEAPTNIASTTLGGSVPLWWRRIPADYRLPWFQGRVLLPLGATKSPLLFLGSERSSIESFREDVVSFLALAPDAAELRLLKRLSTKYIFDSRRGREEATSTEARKLRADMGGAISVTQAVNALLAYGASDPRTRGRTVEWILRQGGKARTLEVIEVLEEERLPFRADYREYIIGAIRRRLGRTDTRESPGSQKRVGAPSEEELEKMRQLLRQSPSPSEFSKILPTMTRFDPEPLAEYLMEWEKPRQKRQDAGLGYVWGSYFGVKCEKNRTVLLKSLLHAKDPYIRVAAAVYLSFEDEATGLRKVREFTKIPGDPGVWAAVSLGRRGDKTVVPHALKVFATSGGTGMRAVPHRNLQKRLMVLLSNSANASGVPQPRPPHSPWRDGERDEEVQSTVHGFYAEWWEEHRARIILHDPWFAMLREQKVD